MCDETYLLESFNKSSRRIAIFEDNGTSAWLYLCGVDDRKPIADVWVHNRISAPPTSAIQNYRGGPPPAASGFADDSTICDDPYTHLWTFAWNGDGESVTLHCDSKPVALLVATERRGWSRNLRRDGPWGNVWDDKRYVAIAKDGG